MALRSSGAIKHGEPEMNGTGPAGESALERFVAAQDGVFATVLAELAAGAKRSHWMWFVFPQIDGLGTSAMARRYAIRDLAQAVAYLGHPLLGPRLHECTQAMLGWAGRRTATAVLGGIDALKLCSSMTLFERADTVQGPSGSQSDGDFARVLDAFYEGRRDPRTLAILDESTRA